MIASNEISIYSQLVEQNSWAQAKTIARSHFEIIYCLFAVSEAVKALRVKMNYFSLKCVLSMVITCQSASKVYRSRGTTYSKSIVTLRAIFDFNPSRLKAALKRNNLLKSATELIKVPKFFVMITDFGYLVTLKIRQQTVKMKRNVG